MTKLFLDDIRRAPDETWVVVRSFDEFVKWIEANGLPDEVSFDHDLGHGRAYNKPRGKRIWIPKEQFDQIPTGYDCAKWMLENHGMPSKVQVHSMNPVGAERIKRLVDDWCNTHHCYRAGRWIDTTKDYPLVTREWNETDG